MAGYRGVVREGARVAAGRGNCRFRSTITHSVSAQMVAFYNDLVPLAAWQGSGTRPCASTPPLPA